MASWNNKNNLMTSPSPTADHFSKMVARSNSAVTNSKSTTTKLRRHVKSEPISTKLIQENAKNEQIQTSYQKRPNYLPIHFQKSQMAPGATEMRDLPGGRRFTPVSSAISHVASPQMAQPNSHLHSPHLSSYPPAYVSHSYAPALASPSANFSQNHEFANAIFLEDENRQLKSKLAALNEKNRKVEFLQNSLDRVQSEFARLSELCARKSQIDEKRIETLESALKQMTLNYQNSQQQLKQLSTNWKSPGCSENDLRASPKLRSSQTDLEEHSSRAAPSQLANSKGEMQSALNSFNFLLRALSEKDDEISSLKKRMQNSHLFGSDRSLDAQADSRGLATPTFARQRPVAATYNVEYLLYGDKYSNGEKMEGQNPPKVLTPPYEF